MKEDEILVTIEHPMGEIEISLSEWIKTGPGPRRYIRPVKAKAKRSGHRLSLKVIPLRYRNNLWSRLLIKLGIMADPWKG